MQCLKKDSLGTWLSESLYNSIRKVEMCKIGNITRCDMNSFNLEAFTTPILTTKRSIVAAPKKANKKKEKKG